ncbi:hypothetical protein COCVIDRAFT_11668 [Bipolaris victoriae FI3]|uniref:Uncharacterized protein n=1 Tax=Bipolaris victoriae (strain FI3) TaxID=930091 RepID=W7F2N5_BIPV3|nr:hypothetical protein COCVIDRAFT_11668 [Bipolaris victoriae FI3]
MYKQYNRRDSTRRKGACNERGPTPVGGARGGSDSESQSRARVGVERLFPHGGEARSRAGEASAVRVAVAGGRRVTCVAVAVAVAAAVLGRPSTVWMETGADSQAPQAVAGIRIGIGTTQRERPGQALFCSQGPVRRNRVSISPRHTLGV